MEFKKITIQGFKNCLEKKEFNLGCKTVISGDNAEGKTTIADAIAWTLTGCDFNGTDKATSRLVNDKSKITECSLDFEINGELHNITRTKKGKGAAQVFLDEVKTTNNEIDKQFIENKDVFFSIFNPMYITAMQPKNAKDFLTKALPKVNKKEVLAELDDNLVKHLTSSGLNINANKFMEDKREELKELGKNIDFLSGIIEGQNKVEIPDELSFDNLTLEKLEIELEELQSTKKTNSKIEELKQKQYELRAKLNNIPFEKPQLVDISVLEAEKNKLAKRYKKLAIQINSVKAKKVKCNNCGNEIDVNLDYKNNLKEQLSEVTKAGKKIANEIIKAKNSNEKSLEEYGVKSNAYKSKIQAELNSLEDDFFKLIDEENKKDAEKLESISKIKLKIKELREEKFKVETNNQNRLNLLKQQEKSKNKIEKAEKDIKESEEKQEEIKNLIQLAKMFNAKKLEIQNNSIGKYLKDVSIQLFKIVKSTGEVKDDFKICYQGRPFNSLSNAERIKAGLEVSNLIMHVLNVKYPIFIDNAESITDYESPDTQIIEAKVVRGQKLQVKEVA